MASIAVAAAKRSVELVVSDTETLSVARKETTSENDFSAPGLFKDPLAET